AGQAQVEGLGHGRAVPGSDERAVCSTGAGATDQLLQDAGAATGDVLLVLGGQVARTHEPAGGGGVGAALPDAGAPVDGGGDAAVLQEGEPGPGECGPRMRSA